MFIRQKEHLFQQGAEVETRSATIEFSEPRLETSYTVELVDEDELRDSNHQLLTEKDAQFTLMKLHQIGTVSFTIKETA